MLDEARGPTQTRGNRRRGRLESGQLHQHLVKPASNQVLVERTPRGGFLIRLLHQLGRHRTRGDGHDGPMPGHNLFDMPYRHVADENPADEFPSAAGHEPIRRGRRTVDEECGRRRHGHLGAGCARAEAARPGQRVLQE